MRRYADPTRCPDCGAVLRAGDPTCPRCRIRLGTPAGAALFAALSAADRELEWLRANRTPDAEAPALVGAGAGRAQAATPEVGTPAAVPVGVPAVRAGGPSYEQASDRSDALSEPYPVSRPVPAPRGEDPRRGLRGASVPRVLLTLSVLSLLIGAAVFMAVTWSRIGIGAQTAILLAATLASAAGSHLLRRRGLGAGSEALVVITAGLAGLDALGAVSAGWFGAGRSGLFGLSVAGVAVAVVGLALATAQRRIAADPVLQDEVAAPQDETPGVTWTPSVATQLAAGLGLLAATWSTVAIHDADRLALFLAVAVLVGAATAAAYVPARWVRVITATTASTTWVALVGAGLDDALAAGIGDGGLTAPTWFGGDALALAGAVALAVVTAQLPRAAEGLRRTAAALAVVLAALVLVLPALDNSLLAFEAGVLGALVVLAVARVVLARATPEGSVAPVRRRWHPALLVGAGVGAVVGVAPTLLLGLLTAGAYASWTSTWSVGPLAALPAPVGIDATLLESTTLLVLAPVVLAAVLASLTVRPVRLAVRPFVVRAAALGALAVAPLTAYAALLGAPVVGLAGAWVLLAAGVGLLAAARRVPALLGAGLAHGAVGLALLLSLPSAQVGAGVLTAWVVLVVAGASGGFAGRSSGAALLRAGVVAVLPLGAATALALHAAVDPGVVATLGAALLVLVACLLGATAHRPRGAGALLGRAYSAAVAVTALAGVAAAVSVGLLLADHAALAYAVGGGAVLCLATLTTLVPTTGGGDREPRGWPLGETLRWLLVAGAGAVTIAVVAAVVDGALWRVPFSEGSWTRLPVVPGEWIATIPVTLGFVALLHAAEPAVRGGLRAVAERRLVALAVVVAAGLLAATAAGLPRVVLVALLLLGGAAATRRTAWLGSGLLVLALGTALASQTLFAVATAVAAAVWALADVGGRRGSSASGSARGADRSGAGAAAVVTGSLSLVVSSDLVGVGLEWSALPVLVLVAALVALGARAGRVDPALEVAAVASGLVAVLFSLAAAVEAADPAALNLVAAVLLAVGGAVVSAHAVSQPTRRRAGWIGSVLVAGSTWLRLVDAGVDVPEAYTLPSALGLLALGLWRVRHDADVSTRRALGPGLYLAVTPSLLVAWTDPTSWRAALLLAACLALVLAGTRLRWSEPLVVGALVGAVLLLREAAPLLSGGPQWIPFVLAGLLLGLVALTWEARTADVRRAASYLGRLR